jgi:hypothetical protein
VTQKYLARVFGDFGEILWISIKENAVDRRQPCQTGCGFIHFTNNAAGVRAAHAAVKKLGNATVDGVAYEVELSNNLHDEGCGSISRLQPQQGSDDLGHQSIRPGLRWAGTQHTAAVVKCLLCKCMNLHEVINLTLGVSAPSTAMTPAVGAGPLDGGATPRGQNKNSSVQVGINAAEKVCRFHWLSAVVVVLVVHGRPV